MRSPALLSLAMFLLVPACARTETVRPAPSVAVTSAPVPPARRGVYRLDFVLTTKDAGVTAPPQTFSYVVEEHGNGEIHAGANVPLGGAVMPIPTGPAVQLGAVARQDTGLRVHSSLAKQDDNVLVDVELELSSAEPKAGGGPATIRKFYSRGKVLAATGKPFTVVTLDEPQKHYDLVVTATQVR